MSGHGAPLRGMLSAARNPEFEGRFGRMFKDLPVATYGKTKLKKKTSRTKYSVLTAIATALRSEVIIFPRSIPLTVKRSILAGEVINTCR